MVEPSFLNSQKPAKRKPRLGENLVRLQRQRSNGQFKITLPRGLAKSLRLQGGEIFEVFLERGDLVLRLQDGDAVCVSLRLLCAG